MGRKKMQTTKKVDIRLRMDSTLAEKIQQAAAEDGDTVASWMRRLASKELKRREKEVDQ